MRHIQLINTTLFFILLGHFTMFAFSQSGTSLNLKKPKEYDERTLRSEKSDRKKFSVPTRFIQNTVTHYNYFFNANNKLTQVVTKAKSLFIEDYSQLLPFYNYSLDVTAADSIQLDSISYKSQTGIALHDLRNDWIDNLYTLWGASYYFQKKFDSAYLMFQYINFAFAPKEKDGYYKTIGSGRDGNSAYSIATKEKNSLPRKLFSEQPSRNDAFIWQLRNFLAQDLFAEAASLIQTLKNDPAFPKRLNTDLEEMQAYLFYKQEIWDSAIVHLTHSLNNASNKQEQARWEYLIAQMHSKTANYKAAEDFYSKAIRHGVDPILEVYARLNTIKINKKEAEDYIKENIAALLKMAKRDKYVEYRDIIYFMAAQMELERNNIDDAIALLSKSTQAVNNSSLQRNKAFLQLAELCYQKKLYRQSYNFYDSLRLDESQGFNINDITSKKESLQKIVKSIDIIERQDSLQKIALLPQDERKDFIKKLVKQYRKSQGLKDESFSTGAAVEASTNNSLFSTAGNKSSNDWYFYNAAARSKGANDFKARWGTRPNVDNWRRATGISGAASISPFNENNNNSSAQSDTASSGTNEISFEAFYNRLPLTDALLKISNDSISNAQFLLGKTLIREIEDCPAGTETLENLRTKFPDFYPMDEVLFNLFYCYQKNAETDKAANIKKLMATQHADSRFTGIVTTGKDKGTGKNNPDATKAYEHIYDLFIEGRFAEAIEKKKIADSLFQGNNWTPQLLYIEAVYYIKQQEDSIAKNVLYKLIADFSTTPLAKKATALIDVLNRRKEIEEELRNLNISRPQEPEGSVVTTNIPTKLITTTDSSSIAKPITKIPTAALPKSIVDSIAMKPRPDAVKIARTFVFEANPKPHYVALLLHKVDGVFTYEAKNAFSRYNKDSYYNKQFVVDLQKADDQNSLLLISPFATAEEALEYVAKSKPKAATEIAPWLKPDKYVFAIISEYNLELLKENKDFEGYKTFLIQYYPSKL